MICPCGGRTMRTQANEASARLQWEQCGACGRCGAYALTVNNLTVATQQRARLAFRDPRLLDIIRRRNTDVTLPALPKPISSTQRAARFGGSFTKR